MPYKHALTFDKPQKDVVSLDNENPGPQQSQNNVVYFKRAKANSQ